MKSDQFVVGLDFGTTKICVIVGRYDPDTLNDKNPKVKILGVGRAPSTGIKKGVVVNIEETVKAIRNAVQEAELMAGVKIQKVSVGIAGAHVRAFNSSGAVGIKGREVQKADIDRVIEAASAVAIPADRKVLHVLPQEYKVDDQGGIRDPLGMMGTRLEAKVHIVTAAHSALQNITSCCHKAGIQVSELVLQPLASAKAVLSKDEMDLGVALVDIGGGTSDLALFHGGCIIHSCVLPTGGVHITQDLAIGLRTPQSEAEKIKISNGTALRNAIEADESLEVPSVGGRPARSVNRSLLGEIIEPRVEEMFRLVHDQINSIGCTEMLGGGIVLTGGSTLLPGMIELAEFIFDLPVKRAFPEQIDGFSDVVMTPDHSTAVGLVHWELEKRMEQSKQDGFSIQKVKYFGDSIRNWIAEFF